MKKLRSFLLKSRFVYISSAMLVSGVAHVLVALLITKESIWKGFFSFVILMGFISYFMYNVFLKNKNSPAEKFTFLQLFSTSKTLPIALGASVGVLLAVAASFIYKPLNIFIALPVAAVVFGLLGFALHKKLKK
jgi:predicted MFS family arabinose efflux permease